MLFSWMWKKIQFPCSAYQAQVIAVIWMLYIPISQLPITCKPHYHLCFIEKSMVLWKRMSKIIISVHSLDAANRIPDTPLQDAMHNWYILTSKFQSTRFSMKNLMNTSIIFSVLVAMLNFIPNAVLQTPTTVIDVHTNQIFCCIDYLHFVFSGLK